VLNASRKVGLEVTAKKTVYMFVSRHRNAGQNYNQKIANKSLENLEKSEYLGIIATS
jgi:hypothetical protein